MSPRPRRSSAALGALCSAQRPGRQTHRQQVIAYVDGIAATHAQSARQAGRTWFARLLLRQHPHAGAGIPRHIARFLHPFTRHRPARANPHGRHNRPALDTLAGWKTNPKKLSKSDVSQIDALRVMTITSPGWPLSLYCQPNQAHWAFG